MLSLCGVLYAAIGFTGLYFRAYTFIVSGSGRLGIGLWHIPYVGAGGRGGSRETLRCLFFPNNITRYNKILEAHAHAASEQ